MANVVRVRVEMNSSLQAPEMEKLKFLMKVFKRKCNEFGIKHSYKEHEFYIKPSEKNRKKRRKNQQQDRISQDRSNQNNDNEA